MRRVEINDITINNYYVCEIHFPNQILDYATRKILIKTAKPLSMAELKDLPAQHRLKGASSKSRRHSDDYDIEIDQDEYEDDDYELEDSKGKCHSNLQKCHCVFIVDFDADLNLVEIFQFK